MGDNIKYRKNQVPSSITSIEPPGRKTLLTSYQKCQSPVLKERKMASLLLTRPPTMAD